MSNARNLARLLPNASGQLPPANVQKLLNSNMASGTVLQVVQVVKTSAWALTGETWTDVPGMSATITPVSANSKILVMTSGYTSHDTSNSFAYLNVYRNGNLLAIGDARGNAQRTSMDATQQMSGNPAVWAKPFTYQGLDSPATTSPVTYKLMMWARSMGSTVLGGTADTADNYRANNPTFLTLMEVAG